MEQEIRTICKLHFDLAHGPVSMSSLIKKLDYLLDTEFAAAFLRGEEEVPVDVDKKTTLLLEEISRLGMSLEMFGNERPKPTLVKF